MEGPSSRLSGIEILRRLRYFPDVLTDARSPAPFRGFGKDHNWTKKYIFWELPYWPTLLIQHNLDVMHVEKNVFNTVMNVKGKTKDNPKARMDLKVICKRPELELKEYNGKVLKPKAKYVLGPDQIKHVCQWLRQLIFPDGYVSNIARAVKIDDGQLYGLKSHDCHIFMQRLIPLAFHDMLDKPI